MGIRAKVAGGFIIGVMVGALLLDAIWFPITPIEPEYRTPTTNPAFKVRSVEHDSHIYIEYVSRDGHIIYDHHLSCPCWPRDKPKNKYN